MPRIVALRPGSVVGADLGHVSFHLGLGVSKLADDWCFSLMFLYPPATTALYRPADSLYHAMPSARTALVQVPISLTEGEEELSRVAAAATGSGSDDVDLRRLTEAFEMFKNRPHKVAQDRLDACVRDAREVVKAYERVRVWITNGMTTLETVPVVTSYAQQEGKSMQTTLVCTP